MSGRPSAASDAYALGRSETETARLVLQNQLFGHLTREFFVSAGIAKGMNVLDVGSGAGDVAITLAELVGPEGGPDWPGYRCVAGTVASLLPFLEQVGAVTAAEVDIDTLEERLGDEVVAVNGIQILPSLFGAWTHA